MSTQTITPRVWIGSLNAYNNGSLIGEWTDAYDLETLESVAADVLKRGGGEEIALMDREGFGDLIGEYEPLERVAEIAAAIEDHGKPFIVYWSQVRGEAIDDVSDAVSQFEDAFAGEFDSVGAFAEQWADDVGAVPSDSSWPLTHIDWDSAGRELELGGDITFSDGYVFYCNV